MSAVLDTGTENYVNFDCVEFLKNLVAIQSHSGEESEAANFIARTMRDIGYDDAFVDAAGNSVGFKELPE